MSNPPDISVVVSSMRSLEMLQACLVSLQPQCDALGAELIVARATPMRRKAADVQFVAVRTDASDAQIRSAGIAAARGEWIVHTEDHCIAAPTWLSRMMSAIQVASARFRDSGGVHVVGGSIRADASAGVVATAAFVAEYGFYGGNATGAGTPPVAAANVAYHRSILPHVVSRMAAGESENSLHEHLFAAGHKFFVATDAVVRPTMSRAFVRLLRDRFDHGRAYASTRQISRRRLLLVIFGAPVLPLLLATRGYRALATADRAACNTAMPLAAVLLAGWTIGELTGYVRRGRAA